MPERSLASELEFDRVLELVAAHARTRAGRSVVRGLSSVPRDVTDRIRSARLTTAVDILIEEDGPFSFTGVDDALPWLEEGAPPPSEPRDLVALLILARRVAAVRRRLENAERPEFEGLLERLTDTSELVALVAPKLKRDGTVADNASPELRRLRREISR